MPSPKKVVKSALDLLSSTRSHVLVAGVSSREDLSGVSLISSNILTLFDLGGTLTTVLTAQFVVFSHFVSPGKRPIRELAAVPVMYGFLIGMAIGGYEVFNNPQVIHKPAMARYLESMKRP